MKAMSLRIRMQTLSPCLTPRLCNPPAMRSERSATSAWVRLRGPLMMPRKSWDVSLIVFLVLGETLGVVVMAGHSRPKDGVACAPPMSRPSTFLLVLANDVDHRDKPGDDGALALDIGKLRAALVDIGANRLGLIGAAEQLLLFDRLGEQRGAGIGGQPVQHALGSADRVRAPAGDLARDLEGCPTRIVANPARQAIS